MPKLFACYLGGRFEGCHIEIHDVQFSVGEVIEECFDDLLSKWTGKRVEFHLDSFLELKYVDGYEIVLSQHPPKNSDLKLYFVNAGGYIPEKFGEVHEIGFYVGNDANEVSTRALQFLCSANQKPHGDDIYDVDDCIAIEKVRESYIHLVRTEKTQDFFPMYFGYGTFDKNLTEKIVHQNY